MLAKALTLPSSQRQSSNPLAQLHQQQKAGNIKKNIAQLQEAKLETSK